MGKVSLKMVLRNFLDHYHKLESSSRDKTTALKEIKDSGRETPPPLSLYDQEYIKLKELTESLKSDSNYPMDEGQSDVNRKKNRYKDILPYDISRVILSEYPGVPGSDYINANYVRGSSGNQRAYIASQGPLPNTLVDFWRMIWETEVLVIIMACNEREAGKYKCEPYWPLNPDEKQQYGNITVEHVKWRHVCPDFLVRTFRVCADNEERTICQFHYTTWPDHGVPISVHPIIELVRLMRDVQSTESRPILVHCSAGCGRTGTICSIDYVWALLRSGKLREDFSLFEIIRDMRRQRTSMVQTVEQYILCYKAVSTLFEQHLKLIDTHTYENIDGDGEPLGIKVLNNEDDESSISVHSLDEQNPTEKKNTLSLEIPPSNANLVEQKANQSLENCALNAHLHRSHSMLDSNDEVRHNEKIVGKATVIRRPSIAKLKAIFDNPSLSSNDLSRTKEETSTNRSSKLQRSQSIKENIRNLNFNIQLEINQSNAQNRKSKSYTLSAAKLSVYKKHFSIGNLTFQDDKIANENRVQDFVEDRANSNNSSNEATTVKVYNSDLTSHKLQNIKNTFLENESRLNAVRSGFSAMQANQKFSSNRLSTQPESVQRSTSRSLSQSQAMNTNSIYSRIPQRPENFRERTKSPSLDDSLPNAPPKPPRTYQHIMDDSCIVRTSEGRLIVTVAQPRQTNTESSFIPIHMNNSRYNYGGNSSIYEPLGTRKFHLSSPNLVLPDQVAFISSNESSSQIKAESTLKRQYCDNSNSNSIYNNSLSSKSFPRSMISINSNQNSQTPMPDSFAFINGAAQYPIDLFGNQHFQYHQAKPIILQQNFFEPIYGTSARPFLPPRSSNLITSNTPASCHGGPPTPSSISQGNFKPPNQTYESIYSNRAMCFKVPNNSKQFNSIVPNSNNSNFTPVTTVEPKENIYAQIGNVKQSNNSESTKTNSDNKTKSTVCKGNSSDSTSKLSPLSKFRNVFKVFRLKNPVSSKLANSSSNASNTKSNDIRNSYNTSTTNAKMPNGTSINPLNGQPLNRPPHSHRFQAPTQWTQV